MTFTRSLVLALVATLACLAAGAMPAAAAPTFSPCATKSGFDCMTVWVPIDRAGTVPGRIPLRVERLRAGRGPFRGTFIMLAGGPGQQGVVPGQGEYESYLQAVAPGWDIVSFDQRGTGESDVLRCEGLEENVLLPPYGQDPFQDAAASASLCATDLGPAAGHYSTADSVEDLEAVRAAIGAGRIALGGVSYGTVVAQAYAAAYPRRVSRLVLDSVVDPATNDGFGVDSLEAATRVLGSLCGAKRCSRITANLVADVRQLDARLAAEPLSGFTVDRQGRRLATTFGGPLQPTALLDLIFAGDLEPVKRALLPGAVRAALRGDGDPLLRLVRPSVMDQFEPSQLSIGLFVATSCLDTRLPWAAGATSEQRLAALEAAANAVPEARRGPFSRGVLTRNQLFGACLGWPFGPRPQPLGPLPDVPALVVNGVDDTRTTVAEARRVAARLPGAQLVLVPNQGHSVIGQAACTDGALRRFMTGQPVGRACRRNGSAPDVAGVPPARLLDVRPVRGLPIPAGRALQAIRATIADLDAGLALASEYTRNDGLILTALRQGTAVFEVDDELQAVVRLRGYTHVPGVRLTGVVRFGDSSVDARLTVNGDRSARGSVALSGGRYSGTLGGRRIDWQVR